METLSNIANAASKAVWGENAGNTTTSANTSTTTHTSASTGSTGLGSSTSGDREMHKSMIDDIERPGVASNGKFESNVDATEGYYDPDGPGKNASDETRNFGSSRDTDRRPEGAGGIDDRANIQRNQNSNPLSNSNEPNQGFGGSGAQPSVDANPSSGGIQTGNQKHQGSHNPLDDPEDQHTGGSSGSVPKPLIGSSGGVGGTKPPPGQGTGEGTGEKYERSTGLAADGGDFDATRPGAAREADRLMEQAGITHGLDTRKDEGAHKENKYIGVDHSGFGGHGSHSNKRSSASDESNRTGSTIGSTTDTTTGSSNTRGTTGSSNTHGTTGTTDTFSTTSATGHHHAAGTTDVGNTGNLSIADKVKEKLHHH